MRGMDERDTLSKALGDAIYARRCKGRLEGIRAAWMKLLKEEMRLREENSKPWWRIW